MTTFPLTHAAEHTTVGDDDIVEALLHRPSSPPVLAHDAKRQKADTPFPWTELHSMPTRQLQSLCSRTFGLLDSKYPPIDALDQYQALVDELEERQRAAHSTGQYSADSRRSAAGFRNNPLASRFELFMEGTLAGYVKYWVQGGQVVLQETVLNTLFQDGLDNEIEKTLIRKAILDAHKRRLALRIRCPRVLSFLTENPQFQRLIPTTTASKSTGNKFTRFSGPSTEPLATR